jgi:AcrR family transcriptional regulator
VDSEKPTEHAAPTKRIRRTAKEAKRVILDAAEHLMSNTGPGGLRLQDVATEVGLAHPVILHHFGSREGLMRALNERILNDLRQRLLNIMTRDATPPHDIVDQLLDSVFTVFRGGLAQRLVWLGADAVPANDPPAAIFSSFVDGLHAHRLSVLPRDPPAARRDTEMLVYLVTVTALGDAVFGTELLGKPVGAGAVPVEARFRIWLSRLLQMHLVTHEESTGE